MKLQSRRSQSLAVSRVGQCLDVQRELQAVLTDVSQLLALIEKAVPLSAGSAYGGRQDRPGPTVEWTDPMEVDEALDFIDSRFAEQHQTLLPSGVMQGVRNLLMTGREVALREADEETFDNKVRELADELIERVEGSTEGRVVNARHHEFLLTGSALDALKGIICPMWPFC